MKAKRRIAALCLVVGLTSCTPEQLIRIRWNDTKDADNMVALAQRESHLQCVPPRNGTGAGLFQLAGHQDIAKGLGYTWEQVHTDCMVNIDVAWHLYLNCGMGPWHKPDWPCWSPNWK